MPIPFHSITEIRIAMPVLDGFPHDAPQASENPTVLQSKSTVAREATHSNKTQNA